jgi:hypothetical protein
MVEKYIQNNDAEKVIWVVSYPKSGNTWVQLTVKTAGASYGFPSDDLDVYKLKRAKKKPTVVKGIKSSVTTCSATVLKTHAVYDNANEIHSELGLSTCGFIYVVRNPLDVLLSFINFSRIQYQNSNYPEEYAQNLFCELLGFDQPMTPEEWSKVELDAIPKENLDHALEYFTKNNTEIPNLKMAGKSWLNHAKSWKSVSNELPNVYLRYEDLIEDNQNILALKEVFDFSNAELLNAISKVNERATVIKGTNIFFNKMSSYYYLEYFSQDRIEKFIDVYKDDLSYLGYTNLPSCK